MTLRLPTAGDYSQQTRGVHLHREPPRERGVIGLAYDSVYDGNKQDADAGCDDAQRLALNSPHDYRAALSSSTRSARAGRSEACWRPLAVVPMRVVDGVLG